MEEGGTGWGGFGQVACDAQQSSQLMQWSWAVTAQHEGQECQNSPGPPFVWEAPG